MNQQSALSDSIVNYLWCVRGITIIENAIKRKQRIFENDKESYEKLMHLRSEEMHRHVEEIKRLQAEYSKALEEIRSILSTIKSEAERNAIEKRINDSIRKRAELTDELNNYVDSITKHQINSDRGLSY